VLQGPQVLLAEREVVHQVAGAHAPMGMDQRNLILADAFEG